MQILCLHILQINIIYIAHLSTIDIKRHYVSYGILNNNYQNIITFKLLSNASHFIYKFINILWVNSTIH